MAQYDIIIIGTGAGGGTLLHKLKNSGKKILVLERGGYLPQENQNWDTIEVFQKEKDLFLKITDNGIGRKEAARIASKSATKYKSMGLLITADRIAMMQRANGNESAVIINDLVDADGETAGTEVQIKIPVKYD